MKLEFQPDRLLALIESHGTTVPELAESIGVSKAIIYRWINGEQIPKLKNVLAMCESLNIQIGYFFPTGKKMKPEKPELEPALV